MPIKLAPVALPDFGPLGEQPKIPPQTYAARADAALKASGTDWLVVYADREHFGNIIFLSGFEPRFEEALLLLGPNGKRIIITGNESVSYTVLAGLPGIEVLRAQTFSLMGQTRADDPRLSDRLRDAGLKPGDSIGLVGWKYLGADEDQDHSNLFFVPDFVVAVLRRLIGPNSTLKDATPVLMHAEKGLRAVVDLDQLAAFEWAAARCSTALWRVVAGVREGDSEFEALRRLGYEGDPLNVHTMFASVSAGENIVGLRSPTARRMKKGDGVTTALGFWGALSSRAGLLTDHDESFLTPAKAYFEALITWYETADIGVEGGTLFSAVTEKLKSAGLDSALNPGHLGSHEEWLHSPVRPGSTEKLRSGMPFQVDVIPVPMPAGWALNCEDAVAFADTDLREAIRTRYPEMHARISARRAFMADALGVSVNENILPLANTPLYLPPFWLRSNHVLTRA
ncbi:M24 family metallopeptidase [Rhizobium sp. BK376]|uniref:M24 family metallopeptidase n=1 Tax=Rhizobium sp. BK376 TaxID=2512149 RepID=UPI001043E37A|nr:M24 family metallopeptidase [Rhizobium sp. BK376]TCR85845.1 Xaa-Pro aminopeptidase [Rhizobium sp. BK376]